MTELTADTIVSIAKTANATSFGLTEAASSYKEELKSMITITAMLTPSQKAIFDSIVPFPVRTTKTYPITHDHPILYALREVTRTIYDRVSHSTQTKLRTLVIGTGEREVRNYSANPYVEYYFHGSEVKDYDRMIKSLLQRIAKTIAKKCRKHEFVTRDKKGERRAKLDLKFKNAREVFDAYCTVEKLPHNIHTEIPGGFEMLLAEDSFYNFEAEDYYQLFQKTGANMMYGYGMLPMEFLFPDMPPNRLYKLHETVDGFCEFTYTNGAFCNGYVHKKSSWETLLKSPVIRNTVGAPFTLVSEIIARVGPFAVFSVMKTNATERLVRELSLPEKYKYVQLLDIYNCVDRI